MSKTKRIRVLKELIELEKCKKEPDQEYIDWAEEEITKLFLILTSMNRKKQETAYENRKLIKAGNRESCRQRKIRLNRERRQALKST